jgi:hypothetical protein
LNGLCAEQTLKTPNYKGLLTLLERILAYSRKHPKPHPAPAPKPAAAFNLAAVTVRPSLFLWQAQCVIYCAMLAFAFVALLPFFLTAFYWILLWLAFAAGIGCAIHTSWRAKNAAPVSFEITQNAWQLKTQKGEYGVTVSGEIVVWQWLVIIPLCENLTGQQHRVIALPDSMNKQDWRRLRVWLKVGL